MLSKRWYAASALTMLVSGGACATSAPTAPKPVAPAASVEREEPSVVVHKRGGDKLIVEVGSAGGTLELGNGARLDIPAGALSETVEITFAEGQHTTAFSNHEYERPVGPTLEIAPPLALNQPFKVSVPLARLPEGFAEKDLTLAAEVVSDTQRAVQMHGTQTRWDYLPAVSDSGRAVAQLSEVPGYRVQFVVSQGN